VLEILKSGRITQYIIISDQKSTNHKRCCGKVGFTKNYWSKTMEMKDELGSIDKREGKKIQRGNRFIITTPGRHISVDAFFRHQNGKIDT
jgi:hypothetical protein